MSRLVRFYPPAWRARYEAEFLALLEDRPARLAERFDVIRGALDAHLHPQLREEPSSPRSWGWPGLATALGGLLFILGGLSWISQAPITTRPGRAQMGSTRSSVFSLVQRPFSCSWVCLLC